MRRIDSGYLKRTAESLAVRRIKTQALQFLQILPGSRVVDVGCGPAIDTIEMARLVGPTGTVLGIDADPAMVEEANRLAVAAGVGAFTRHVVGDAAALSNPANEFDACFSERLLQHLSWANASRAAREMVRVLRPEGRLAIIDTDWGTMSVASPDPWLERRVVYEHFLQFPHPFSGRFLLSAFRTAGLTDITIETFSLPLSFEAVEFLLGPAVESAVVAGRLSRRLAQSWSAGLSVVRDYGAFFAHVSMVLLVGRKSRASETTR